MKKNIISLIGGTPTVRLEKIEKHFGLKCRLFAKLEGYNPSGSAKDRAALWIIKDAVERGFVKEGATVVEATSGNMGVSLSMLTSFFGYRAAIFMPEGMSDERLGLIKAYGGEVILTPPEEGMSGATKMAKSYASQMKKGYFSSQFTNKQSFFAHYQTTGPEVFADVGGKVDIFVCGVGTGGSLMGVGSYLKRKRADTRVIAVEPAESAILSGGVAASHGILGIGAGFLPPLVDLDLIDRVVSLSTDEAIESSRALARVEGIFAGFSSGAVLSAAILLGKLEENKDKNIAILLPDRGDRYLSILSQ